MTDTLAKNDQNLIWIDLEMTGLFPETDRIIEIAVIVTDSQLNVRVEGPALAVHQSDAVLDGMDAWNKGTHGRSGLTDRVRASTVDEATAEAALCATTYVFLLPGSTGAVAIGLPLTPGMPMFSGPSSPVTRSRYHSISSPTTCST